jgi:hypothetical protein
MTMAARQGSPNDSLFCKAYTAMHKIIELLMAMVG